MLSHRDIVGILLNLDTIHQKNFQSLKQCMISGEFSGRVRIVLFQLYRYHAEKSFTGVLGQPKVRQLLSPSPWSIITCILDVIRDISLAAHIPNRVIADLAMSGLESGRAIVKYSHNTVNTPFPISLTSTSSPINFSKEVSSPRVAPLTKAMRFLHITT